MRFALVLVLLWSAPSSLLSVAQEANQQPAGDPNADSFQILSVSPSPDTPLRGNQAEFRARVRYSLNSMEQAIVMAFAERYRNTPQGCYTPAVHQYEGSSATLVKKGTGEVEVTVTWHGSAGLGSIVPEGASSFVGLGMSLWPERDGGPVPPGRSLGISSFCYTVLADPQDTTKPQPSVPESTLAELMNERKFSEAHVLLDALHKDNPDSPEVLFLLGTVNLAEHRLQEAEDAFRRSYKLSPANSAGLMGIIEIYMAQNKTDEALRILQSESDRAPYRLDLLLALGGTGVRAGKYDLAIQTYTGMLEHPDKGHTQGDIYLRIAEVYRRKGDANNAVQALQKARETLPDSTLVLSTLGLVLDGAQRRPEAKAIYEATIKLDPNNAVALNNLAFLLAETGGDLDDALTKAQLAKQLMPGLPEINDTLGWIYLKKNLADNAIEIFRDLVTKEPDHSTYHFHLGMAYSQKGDQTNALDQLREALSKQPSNEEKDKIEQMIARMGSSVAAAPGTNLPPAGNSNADPSQLATLLIGSWLTKNQGGLTQVNVRREGERILAHVWGQCSPADCD